MDRLGRGRGDLPRPPRTGLHRCDRPWRAGVAHRPRRHRHRDGKPTSTPTSRASPPRRASITSALERLVILFITGGARSGKSTGGRGGAPCGRAVVFVATATAGDDEMAAHRPHQNERPDEWTTVEGAVRSQRPSRTPTRRRASSSTACPVGGPCVDDDETLSVEALDLRLGGRCRRQRRPGPTIVVSNEVGSGIVPDNLLGRSFRDLLERPTSALLQWLIVRALGIRSSRRTRPRFGTLRV